jgi:predicted amidohydrolase YtcJ
VQPAFDAEWGGPDRMYAHRLGVERTAGLNPFAGLLAAGVPLAFGSDSPVTPFAPWEGIRAALRHRTARHRIDLAAALTGHLRAARRAGGASTAGDRLAVGDRATFATWRTPALAGHPAGLLARLERELASGAPAPVLERLVIGGQHAAGERSE